MFAALTMRSPLRYSHVLILYAQLICLSDALKCFVMSADEKRITLEENAEWQYCAYHELMTSYTVQAEPRVHVRTSHAHYFGVSNKTMHLAPTNAAFSESEPDLYEVISNCVLERYNGEMFGGEVEFAFRCLCATEACNKGPGVKHYLHHNVRQHVPTDK